ncbi:putative monooxygenase [Moniliophthora roreri MCA 2997]|uniref:Monooxygenase n=1 Tax=Moniliophthora roreri (strain MCA 2997) TaxID=1381753 RepID=V2WCE8_MONRO|nr:putative monooxygenase [Moniliophthora roreri MCA 2997]
MAPVLIVGAGPSGLALALSLLRNGIPVRIIDKLLVHGVGQRGAGIQPRTLELYKVLGILQDIQKMAGPIQPRQFFTSPEGPAPVKEVPMFEDLDNTPEYPLINPVMLGQDRHEALLRHHLQKDYNTHVELGTELVTFSQTTDFVEAKLVKHGADGEDITTETARFEFLVGADGAKSLVRKQLGLTFLGESRPGDEAAMVIGDVRIKKGIPDRKYWRVWGDAKSVTLRPCEIDDDSFNFVAGGADLDLENINSDMIFRHISQTIGRELEFGDLIWAGVWRPNIRMVDKFGEGRVFVVGDAAHVHSPTGGQGLNSGIQDSVNLAWKIALVHKGVALISLLTSYTTERLPVIAHMLNKTTELLDKTVKEVQDSHTINAEGFVRGFELRQLGVNYRSNSLLVDERHKETQSKVVDPYRSGLDGTLRAGDRAPDAPGLLGENGSETTLFNVLSPAKHTVVVFAGEGNEVLSEALKAASTVYPRELVQYAIVYPDPGSRVGVAEVQAEYILVDKEGFAFRHYKVRKDDRCRFFVVRPDAYIGAITQGIEGLQRYGNTIFNKDDLI